MSFHRLLYETALDKRELSKGNRNQIIPDKQSEWPRALPLSQQRIRRVYCAQIISQIIDFYSSEMHSCLFDPLHVSKAGTCYSLLHNLLDEVSRICTLTCSLLPDFWGFRLSQFSKHILMADCFYALWWSDQTQWPQKLVFVLPTPISNWVNEITLFNIVSLSL